MGVLLVILGVITTISVWYWRLQMLSRAAKGGLDAAKTVANLPRKMAFKHQAGKQALSIIDDPREAAAVMMMEIAQARGALTQNQTDMMRSEIMRHFQYSADDADALIAHAGWLGRDAPAPHNVMARMSNLVLKSSSLGPKELVDLDSMLVAVSEAEGTPLPEQLSLLQIYRDKTGLLT